MNFWFNNKWFQSDFFASRWLRPFVEDGEDPDLARKRRLLHLILQHK